MSCKDEYICLSKKSFASTMILEGKFCLTPSWFMLNFFALLVCHYICKVHENSLTYLKVLDKWSDQHKNKNKNKEI